MTAAQNKARARFKAAVKDAAKLRKKNPKLSQADAVKQAFAALYGKERAGRKVGAPAKKTARKPAARAPKRAPAKCAPAKKETRHTDTNSHNVNIRVMSGLNTGIDTHKKKAAQDALKELEAWQKIIDGLRAEYRSPKYAPYKKNIRKDIQEAKKWIAHFKTILRQSISGIK